MLTSQRNLASTPGQRNSAVLSRVRIAFRSRLAIAARQRNFGYDRQRGRVTTARIVLGRWAGRTPSYQREPRRQT